MQYFQYSPDENTQLIASEASRFLKRSRTRGLKYDIINVDIYIEGPSDIQDHEYFWSDVSGCLTDKGVSVANIWRHGEFEEKYNRIVGYHKKLFNTVFEIVNSKTNQVALFGSQMPIEFLLHPKIDIEAIEMSGLSGVDFRKHLNNLKVLK